MENFLHKLLLNRCYLCDAFGEIICDFCLSKFEISVSRSSKQFSFFKYNDLAKRLLQLSKYPPYHFVLLKFLTVYGLSKRKNELLNFLDFSTQGTVLCPIPLSSLKIYDRRFNQAQIISEEIEKRVRILSVDILKRVKDTPPLFDLDKSGRRKVLDGAFRPSMIFYLLRIFKIGSVVLVDDLVTTSQTFMICSKILKSKGIPTVKLITLFSKD